MKVSINEREQVGGAEAQTKYFIQGTASECYMLLELLEHQAADRLALEDAKVIDLPAIRLGEKVQAAACAEGQTPITLDVAPIVSLSHEKLLAAVHAVYYAAWWKPDRDVGNLERLWMNLRNAAGFPPGAATSLLGENRHGLTSSCAPPPPFGAPTQDEPALFYELRAFLQNMLSDPRNLAPVEWHDSHMAAKMFMALWRKRANPKSEPSRNDQYYLDSYNKRLENRAAIRAAVNAVHKS